MVVDLTSRAKSVCDQYIDETKFHDSKEVSLFFSVAVLMPLVAMVILAIVVRSQHKTIQTKITSKSGEGYHNLVGFTLTSAAFMIYILCMDILAAFEFLKNEHYFKIQYLNTSAPVFTLLLDLGITATALCFTFYLCCVKLCCVWPSEFMRALTILYFRLYVAPYFLFIFGSNRTVDTLRILAKQKKAADAYDKDSTDALKKEKAAADEEAADVQEEINVWVIVGVIAAPLFCFTSHGGYLVMALVTRPDRTTEVSLYALATCLYLFFMFRQCYILHANEQSNTDETTPTMNAGANHTRGADANPMGKAGANTRREGAHEETPLLSPTSESAPQYETNIKPYCCQRLYSCCKWLKDCEHVHIYIHVLCIILPIIHLGAALLIVLGLTLLAQILGLIYYMINGFLKVYKVCCYHRHCEPQDKQRQKDEEKCCYRVLEKLEKNFTWETRRGELSYRSFFLTFCTSGLIAIPPALILASLAEIPVSTYTLVQYLEALSQIVIVVIGLLLTYKVFSPTATESESFMKAFKDAARTSEENKPPGQNEDKHDILEAGGTKAGELTRELMKYLQHKKAKREGEEQQHMQAHDDKQEKREDEDPKTPDLQDQDKRPEEHQENPGTNGNTIHVLVDIEHQH